MKLTLKPILLSFLLIFSGLYFGTAVAQEHGLITWVAYSADDKHPDRVLITYKMIEKNG